MKPTWSVRWMTPEVVADAGAACARLTRSSREHQEDHSRQFGEGVYALGIGGAAWMIVTWGLTMIPCPA